MSDKYEALLRERMAQQQRPEGEAASFLDTSWADSDGAASVRDVLEAHHKAGVLGLTRFHGALERYLEEPHSSEELRAIIEGHSNQVLDPEDPEAPRAWLHAALEQLESVLFEG